MKLKHTQYGLGFKINKSLYNNCQCCRYYRDKYYGKSYCERKKNRNLTKCKWYIDLLNVKLTPKVLQEGFNYLFNSKRIEPCFFITNPKIDKK